MDSPAPAASLLSLPDELLERVLLELQPRDIAAASETCRTLKDVTQSSISIQYNVTLSKAGYLDIPVRYEAIAAARAREQQQAAEDGPPAESSTGLTGDAAAGSSSKEPRPTIRSVKIGPRAATTPKTRADYSALSTAAKWKALRARERRWSTLSPAQRRHFSVRGPSGVYELQEGILLMCEEDEAFEKPHTIRLIPLPSAEDPDIEDPSVPIKSHKVDFPIADLTMDPSQDLIVVSEYDPETSRPGVQEPAHRYHFLTLSTFEPHPLAAQPFIDFPPVSVPTEWPRQLIQVMGDTLVAHISREGLNVVGLQGQQALISNDSEEEMVAWNWKTGKVLGRIHLGRTTSPCTFCMLSPTTVAIARPTVTRQTWDHVNPTMRLPQQVVDYPCIMLVSFAQKPGHTFESETPLLSNRRDKTTPRAVQLARLYLPPVDELSGALTVDHFHMRPDPAFPPVPSSQATLGRGKPFTQDPSRGLMVMELWIGEGHYRPSSFYELFVLRETLVKMAEEGEARLLDFWSENTKTEFETRSLPWSEWGVENARFMPEVSEERRPWVCSCSGYRLVSLIGSRNSFGGEPWRDPEVEDPDQPEVQPPYKKELVVHDFNPYSVAQARAELKQRGVDGSSWVATSKPDDEADMNGGQDLGDEYTVTLWDEPTVIPADEIWTEDVVSKLPFTTVRIGVKQDPPPNGVMMDGERILTVRTTKRNQEWQNQLHDFTVLCF